MEITLLMDRNECAIAHDSLDRFRENESDSGCDDGTMMGSLEMALTFFDRMTNSDVEWPRKITMPVIYFALMCETTEIYWSEATFSPAAHETACDAERAFAKRLLNLPTVLL
jgi:hypothetical protein